MKQLMTLVCTMATVGIAIALTGCGGWVGDLPDLDFGESFQGERAGPAAGAGDGAGDNADVTRDDTDLSDDDGGAVDQSADLPDDDGDAADEGPDLPDDEGGGVDEGADLPDDGGGAADEGADLPDDGRGAADEGADLPDDDGGLTDLAAALVGTWQAESAVVNGQVLAVAVVGGYDGSVDSVTIEIRADGTLTGYAYAGSDLVMTESGTWSASNTSATIGWSSYQVAWDSVVSDDVLTMRYESPADSIVIVWTRVS